MRLSISAFKRVFAHDVLSAGFICFMFGKKIYRSAFLPCKLAIFRTDRALGVFMSRTGSCGADFRFKDGNNQSKHYN